MSDSSSQVQQRTWSKVRGISTKDISSYFIRWYMRNNKSNIKYPSINLSFSFRSTTQRTNTSTNRRKSTCFRIWCMNSSTNYMTDYCGIGYYIQTSLLYRIVYITPYRTKDIRHWNQYDLILKAKKLKWIWKIFMISIKEMIYPMLRRKISLWTQKEGPWGRRCQTWANLRGLDSSSTWDSNQKGKGKYWKKWEAESYEKVEEHISHQN